MDELSALLLAKALDGLSMRATAIAQNIANAGSPAYAPLRVSFENELRSALPGGIHAVSEVEPHYVRSEGAAGELRLDLEMAGASHTALRYAALSDVLNRQMQIARLAVSGGQR